MVIASASSSKFANFVFVMKKSINRKTGGSCNGSRFKPDVLTFHGGVLKLTANESLASSCPNQELKLNAGK